MAFTPTLIIVIICLSFFLLHISQKVFINKKIIDKVKQRSSHSSVATRSGGLSIFLTIFIISCYFYGSGYEIYDFSIIVPLSILMVVGLYDDVYNMDFKLKFIFQIIAAKILIDNGLIIDNLHGVFGVFELNRIFAQLITIFIIVAIINSINFIDGIDGLAILIVSTFIISFEYFSSSSSPFINLSLLIITSCIPLLYYNFKNSKKVFLGDSGSLMFGGIVATYVLYILSQDYIIKPEYDLHKILFVISILIFPIIDLTRVFTIRVIKGKSPFKPDKNHIHHIVLKKIKNHFLTTIFLALLTILFIIFIQIIF